MVLEGAVCVILGSKKVRAVVILGAACRHDCSKGQLDLFHNQLDLFQKADSKQCASNMVAWKLVDSWVINNVFRLSANV